MSRANLGSVLQEEFQVGASYMRGNDAIPTDCIESVPHFLGS
jgi:hypothetical protein